MTQGLELVPTEHRTLARAHFDLWLHSGTQVDMYNLTRAIQLYETALREHSANIISPSLEYCQALQCGGHMNQATDVIMTILTSLDDDPDPGQGPGSYPGPDRASHLFHAGGLFKAQGLHDKASNYFFEATQIGPPKFFSKLEMMMILSRNIEESGKLASSTGTGAGTGTEEPSDDAYEMVYTHLVIEQVIPSTIEYDDWISDANTWRVLADKCVLHNLYSLAADLYAQGIMKDANAFRKSKLWFAFAKACFKCGRLSDAQLGIMQALTRDPFNQQLLRTLQCWKESSSNPSSNSSFQTLLLNTNISPLLDEIPDPVARSARGIARVQAFLRGFVTRQSVSLGIGKRLDIKDRMSARVGLLMSDTCTGSSTHPVLVYARADWMGRVRSINVFDCKYSRTVTLRLKKSYAPPKQYGIPRHFRLQLTCTCASTVRNEEEYRDILHITFIDKETGEYIMCDLKLPPFSQIFSTPPPDMTDDPDLSKPLKNNSSLTIETPNHEQDFLSKPLKNENLSKPLKNEIPGDLSLRTVQPQVPVLEVDSSLVITTDMVDIEVGRGAIQRFLHVFLYRVHHEEVSTRYIFTNPSSMKTVTFVTSRDHIDRAHHLKRSLHALFDIIDENNILSNLVREIGDGQGEAPPPGHFHAPISHEITITSKLTNNDDDGGDGDDSDRISQRFLKFNVFYFAMDGNIEIRVRRDRDGVPEGGPGTRGSKDTGTGVVSGSLEVLDKAALSGGNALSAPSRAKRRSREASFSQALARCRDGSGYGQGAGPGPGSVITSSIVSNDKEEEGDDISVGMPSSIIPFGDSMKGAETGEGDGTHVSNSTESAGFGVSIEHVQDHDQDSHEGMKGDTPNKQQQRQQEHMKKSKSKREIIKISSSKPDLKKDREKEKEVLAIIPVPVPMLEFEVERVQEEGQEEARALLLDSSAEECLLPDAETLLMLDSIVKAVACKAVEEAVNTAVVNRCPIPIPPVSVSLDNVAHEDVQLENTQEEKEEGEERPIELNEKENVNELKEEEQEKEKPGDTFDIVGVMSESVAAEAISSAVRSHLKRKYHEDIIQQAKAMVDAAIAQAMEQQTQAVKAEAVEGADDLNSLVSSVDETATLDDSATSLQDDDSNTSYQDDDQDFGSFSEYNVFASDESSSVAATKDTIISDYQDEESVLVANSNKENEESVAKNLTEIENLEDMKMIIEEDKILNSLIHSLAEKEVNSCIEVVLSRPSTSSVPAAAAAVPPPSNSDTFVDSSFSAAPSVVVSFDDDVEEENYEDNNTFDDDYFDDEPVPSHQPVFPEEEEIACTPRGERRNDEDDNNEDFDIDPNANVLIVDDSDYNDSSNYNENFSPEVSERYTKHLLNDFTDENSDSLLYYEELATDYELRQLGLSNFATGSSSKKKDIPKDHMPLPPSSSPASTASIAKNSLMLLNPSKSSSKLHKPLKLQDIPLEAYESPEMLRAALARSLDDESYFNNNNNSTSSFNPRRHRSINTNPLNPITSISDLRRVIIANPDEILTSAAINAPGKPSSKKTKNINKDKLNRDKHNRDKDKSKAAEPIEVFKARGYVTGDKAYSTHWESKIITFLKSHPTASSLRIALSSLQKNLPIQINRLEALCALADTDGNDVRALGKLADEGFLREVKLVCNVLKVENLVSVIPGGAGVLAGGVGHGVVHDLRTQPSGEAGMMMMPSSSVSLASESVSDMSSLALDGDAYRNPVPAYSTSNACSGFGKVRVGGVDASRMLPHLSMEASSAIVRRRGSILDANRNTKPMLSKSMGALPPLTVPVHGLRTVPVHAPVPVPAHAAIVRLDTALDAYYESSPSSKDMVVLCRRDALRAQGEELLARSRYQALTQQQHHHHHHHTEK